MKDQLSQLLRDPELEKLSLLLRRPNVFRIMGAEEYELRHSNFLAWLLDPAQGHGLGDTFIKWFLRHVFADQKTQDVNEFQLDFCDFSNAMVRREWNHIDLLIETDDFVVCIENKLHSQEHSRQLRRYRQVVADHFPRKNHCFVFLTPLGGSPVEEEDEASYVIVDYAVIVDILQTLMDLYRDSIPQKIQFYLTDYIELIKRRIMAEGKDVELARQLYLKHKDALDFIFDHKPDRLSEVGEVVEEVVSEFGYLPTSSNKGYARFITEKLSPVIPPTAHGWKNHEQFLFELDYWPKSLCLKAIIAPGNEHNRTVLLQALSRITKYGKSRGKVWIAPGRVTKKNVDLTSDGYENPEKIRKVVSKFLAEHRVFVEDMEAAILQVAENLER